MLKEKRLKQAKTISIILLLVALAICIALLFLKMNFYLEQQDQIKKTISSQLRSVNQLIDGQNEVRIALDFDALDDISEDIIEDKEDESPSDPFYKALDNLMETTHREANQRHLQLLFNQIKKDLPRTLTATLTTNGFTVQNQSYQLLSASLNGNTITVEALPNLSQDFNTQHFQLDETVLAVNRLIKKSNQKLAENEALAATMKREFQQWYKQFNASALKRDYGLAWETDSKENTWILKRIDKTTVVEIELQIVPATIFKAQGIQYKNFNALKKVLESDFLTQKNLKSWAAKDFKAKTDYLNTLFQNKEFKNYLKKNKLSVNPQLDDDEHNYYYYFLDQENAIAGAFAIQKGTNEIYLMDKDLQPISAIKNYSQNNVLQIGFQLEKVNRKVDKKLDLEDAYVLLVGKNSENTDSIMLLHLRKDKGLAMLSIPRDLYLDDKWRVNTLYKYRGIDYLVSRLQSILGVPIDRYVVIDMFAFIDVINILGGIDITLEEALIDPTYKTKNNGVFSSLNYSKGTHHLNGREALRVARSRHTSSDFARAKRQQDIIAAVQKKLTQNVNINNTYAFFNTAQKYLETNLSPIEIVDLFLEYRDSSVKKNGVMSTKNILTATYSNLYKLSLKDQLTARANLEYDLGAWILLPTANNWGALQVFTHETLALN